MQVLTFVLSPNWDYSEWDHERTRRSQVASNLNTSLFPQYASHSDSSLATGSSEGSLQTTMEEGLSFSVSSPQDPDFPLHLLEPLPDRSTCSLSTETLRPAASSVSDLQATRGHQRSQSSNSPLQPWQGTSQESNSEQLSETLSSLSLTSLLSPSTLAPPSVKKCNSMGNLEQGAVSGRGKEGRQLFVKDAQGHLATPWVEGRKGAKKEPSEASRFEGKSTSQVRVVGSRKNRWNIAFCSCCCCSTLKPTTLPLRGFVSFSFFFWHGDVWQITFCTQTWKQNLLVHSLSFSGFIWGLLPFCIHSWEWFPPRAERVLDQQDQGQRVIKSIPAKQRWK